MSKDVTSKGTSVKTREFKESAAAVAVKKGEVAPKTNLPGAKGVVKKAKVLIPDIIRGRMPIAVVAMVRFGDQKNGDVRSLAKMFGTTVGKITDIKKNSTFTYLPATFRPTAQQRLHCVFSKRGAIRIDSLFDQNIQFIQYYGLLHDDHLPIATSPSA